MTWTPEHRRRYAPALDHTVRTNAVTRLAAPIDAIDPPCAAGRPRLWSTLVMLQALWWLCRAGLAWKLLPGLYPPRQTIGSRLERWRRLEVLERARRAQRLPAPGARPQVAAQRRHPRHPERADWATGRATRVRCRQEGERQEAGAAGRHRGPGPGGPDGAGLGAGPRHAGRARARACAQLLAEGLGRPRLQR